LLALKVAPWQGQYSSELWKLTVHGLCVQVALKAFHWPLRLSKMEFPCEGCVKYAEVFPLRLESCATRT